MSNESNANTTFTQPQVRALADRCLSGSGDAQLLHDKDGRLVYRITADAGQSLIVKLLPPPPPPRRLRQKVRMRRIAREQRLLDLLAGHGVRVPRVLGFAAFVNQTQGPAYAKILEDLGPGVDGMDHAQQLIRERNLHALESFENQVIDITHGMIRLGVFDTDHGIVNFHVTGEGQVARIDLDDARQARVPACATRLYARMVGRLVATYAFAVQPDVQRANDFNRRLSQRLHFTPRVQRKAQAYIQQQMDHQRLQSGIDTHVVLPAENAG